jgi:hypothetical protein
MPLVLAASDKFSLGDMKGLIKFKFAEKPFKFDTEKTVRP